jgi:hypothetical protein
MNALFTLVPRRRVLGTFLLGVLRSNKAPAYATGRIPLLPRQVYHEHQAARGGTGRGVTPIHESRQPGGSATRWGPLFSGRARHWAETWEGPRGWGTSVYEQVLDRMRIGDPRARLRVWRRPLPRPSRAYSRQCTAGHLAPLEGVMTPPIPICFGDLGRRLDPGQPAFHDRHAAPRSARRRRRISQHFRRFTRVAARLLHVRSGI